MDLKLLKKLRESLPKDWVVKVYDSLYEKKGVGLSKSYIRMVLAGTRNNQDVLEEIIALAETTKKEEKELAKKIKSI